MVAAFCAFLTAGVPPARAQALGVIDQRLREGVVRISAAGPEGTIEVGTGIVVGVQGTVVYIATALHVLAGPEEGWDRTGFDRDPARIEVGVVFFQQPGLRFAGRIFPRWDRKLDLAVVTIDDPRVAQLGVGVAFAISSHNVLQPPYGALAIGQPERVPWAVAEVSVTGGDTGQVLMAGARLGKGFSGGALLDQRRQVLIGMLQSVSLQGNRALPMTLAAERMRAWGVPLGLHAANVSAPMVRVPGGSFTMGSRQGPEDVRRERVITLDAYYIDRYEVTTREFRRFVEETGYAYVAGLPTCHFNEADSADLPMNCATWHDAQAFARWAGKALPTEAQWEYAARGSSGGPLPWGGGPMRAGDAAIDLPKASRGGSYFRDVSIFGVMDMLGNVSEWTADWYAAPYAGEAQQRNPQGPTQGEDRVIRGASYGSDLGRASLVRRHRDLPENGRSKLAYGFRCVLPGS
jgi:formylglycine-generating enzyme required for sulfatase activity